MTPLHPPATGSSATSSDKELSWLSAASGNADASVSFAVPHREPISIAAPAPRSPRIARAAAHSGITIKVLALTARGLSGFPSCPELRRSLHQIRRRTSTRCASWTGGRAQRDTESALANAPRRAWLMLNRADEEKHLQLADAHVVRAEELIARTERLIQDSARHGGYVEPAMRSLDAMRDVLSAFVAHRDYLLRTISDIDAGRL